MQLSLNIKLIILACAILFCLDHPFLVGVAALFYFATKNFSPTDGLVMKRFAKEELQDFKTANKVVNYINKKLGKDKTPGVGNLTAGGTDYDAEIDDILAELPDVAINSDLKVGDQIVLQEDGNYKVESAPVEETLNQD